MVDQFSALSSGQPINFNPGADFQNFDQPYISAASLGVIAEGANAASRSSAAATDSSAI